MNRSRNEEPRLVEHRLVFGILLLDRDGNLLVSNQPATAILEEGNGLGVVDRRLVAGEPTEQALLHALIGDATRGETGPVLPVGGVMSIARRRHRPLSVLVAPLSGPATDRARDEASAVVFVVDPEQPGQSWRQFLERLYGLTHAEADVAILVLNGTGVSDIARHRQTTLNTARTHLKRVFDKLGVHSQADLVRLLLAGESAPRPRTAARSHRRRRAV